jgi:hypothetical protein
MISLFYSILSDRRTLCLAIASASLSLGGCIGFLSDYQASISAKERRLELVTVTPNSKWDNVIDCVKSAGGMCGVSRATPQSLVSLRAVLLEAAGSNTPASFAAKALTDDTAQAFEDIMRYSAGASTQNKSPTTISRAASEVFAKNLLDATNTGGWSDLTARLIKDDQRLSEKMRALTGEELSQVGIQRAQIAQSIDYSKQIGAYLSAYFDNGDFISLSVDPSNLQASALAELQAKLGLSADAAKAAVGDLLKQLTGQTPGTDGKYHLITSKDNGGFVTRGGDKYSFPTISVTITPGASHLVSATKVDFPQIGADIIRVYIEAVGDLWGQLPGTQKSTGVKSALLREYGKDASKKEQVSETDFMKVNSISSTAETATASVTGQVIRGIGWVSLNNEALAKLIETAVGVVARKGTEKVAWCIEACKGVGIKEFASTSPQIARIQVWVVE